MRGNLGIYMHDFSAMLKAQPEPVHLRALRRGCTTGRCPKIPGGTNPLRLLSSRLLLVFFLVGAPLTSLAQEVAFFYGKKETKLEALPYVRPPYINLLQFLRALGTQPAVQDGIIEVEINRRQLTMNIATGVANFNRRTHSFPIRTKNGAWYVRVDVLSEVMSEFLGRRMIYEPTSKSLHLPLARDLVVTVRTRQIGDSYRIILIYSDTVTRPTLRVSGRKMILKIREKNIQLDRVGFVPNEAVEKMQVFQNLPDGSTEILFTISESTKKWDREQFNPENPRTVIKLTGDYKGDLTGILQQVGEDSPGLRRIVIDPGHGGIDRGAMGPTGLREKDVTLDLALKLKEALENDYEVRLTREDDTLLSLKNRTAIANNFEADLFLSIHVNAINLAGATGSETYYLSMDAEVPDQPHYGDFVSEDEPEATPVIPEDDLSLILWDAAQTKFAEDSFRVARHVQETLNILSGIRNRGVKQASLKVLKGATMPAVLVEVAFISNVTEEKKLKTPEFRTRIVNALDRAIRLYDEDLRKRSRDGATNEGF